MAIQCRCYVKKKKSSVIQPTIVVYADIEVASVTPLESLFQATKKDDLAASPTTPFARTSAAFPTASRQSSPAKETGWKRNICEVRAQLIPGQHTNTNESLSQA